MVANVFFHGHHIGNWEICIESLHHLPQRQRRQRGIGFRVHDDDGIGAVILRHGQKKAAPAAGGRSPVVIVAVNAHDGAPGPIDADR